MRIDKRSLLLTVLLVVTLTMIGAVDSRAEDGFGSLAGVKEGDVIKMKIDIEREREVQDAVDQGHQPWRYDPKGVAFSEPSADHRTTYESCNVIHEGSAQAKVRCDGTYRYLVELRRLVRADGIWTVTSITVLQKMGTSH